jgi:hypothetical protein
MIRSGTNTWAISRKPPCSAPIRLRAGTRQSANDSSAVSEQSQPILSSLRDTVKPGVSLSMTSRLMPDAPGPPVRTAVVTKSARVPEVMNILAPLTT